MQSQHGVPSALTAAPMYGQYRDASVLLTTTEQAVLALSLQPPLTPPHNHPSTPPTPPATTVCLPFCAEVSQMSRYPRNSNIVVVCAYKQVCRCVCVHVCVSWGWLGGIYVSIHTSVCVCTFAKWTTMMQQPCKSHLRVTKQNAKSTAAYCATPHLQELKHGGAQHRTSGTYRCRI